MKISLASSFSNIKLKRRELSRLSKTSDFDGFEHFQLMLDFLQYLVQEEIQRNCGPLGGLNWSAY
jgi:hypothetical protein